MLRHKLEKIYTQSIKDICYLLHLYCNEEISMSFLRRIKDNPHWTNCIDATKIQTTIGILCGAGVITPEPKQLCFIVKENLGDFAATLNIEYIKLLETFSPELPNV